MSLQPPPQPPSPGFGQSGQGLGFGPPVNQPGARSGAGGGGDRPGKTRHVAPGMIVSAVVLIAVAVGVFLLANGSDDALDADGAADGFAAVIDDADFDDLGTAGLRRCPLGDPEELAEQVADVLDLSNDVLDGDSVAAATEEDGSRDPAVVWCQQREELAPGSEGVPGSLSLNAGELPRGDWEDFVEDNTLDGSDVDFADPEDFRGGVIQSYCVEGPDDQVACGAAWLHEDSNLGIVLAHTTDDDDPGPAVEALKLVLPSMIESLAAQA